MRIVLKALIATTLLSVALPALAQEVIVTAQRRGYNNNDASYSNGIVATSRPIINLKRTADYAVQTVRVVGDTRDFTTRRADLHATIRNMIAAAGKAGVELATGDYVLAPLTLASYESLPFTGDGRPDTDQTNFLVKVRLTPGMTIEAAKAKIAQFVASVPKVGRSQVSSLGELTLSVINPDQYRGQIIDLIAADAALSAAKFGTGSGVDVTGLDRPVEWARGGPTDVFLFLPSSYTVRKD
ncbi:TonB-dependent receptor [Sphingomonas sp. So64.6b]|uniref:TonB-dependent receptor n=1 Tax=Sphingomonas sp. So64.6b TaxID=2997354 RepID=UPI001FCE9DE0|nr:TonB-dependent receptor [Sphingomonas sp. So64.6b]